MVTIQTTDSYKNAVKIGQIVALEHIYKGCSSVKSRKQQTEIPTLLKYVSCNKENQGSLTSSCCNVFNYPYHVYSSCQGAQSGSPQMVCMSMVKHCR